MKTTKEPQRAWLYARVPGNYIETKNTLNVLMLQAQRDGAEVVGWGYDIHHGWLRRPAYRRMMREAKAGHIERIYICRMSQISGTERHLISFFRRFSAMLFTCSSDASMPSSLNSSAICERSFCRLTSTNGARCAKEKD